MASSTFWELAAIHQESSAKWSRISRTLRDDGFVNSACYWQIRAAQEAEEARRLAAVAENFEAVEAAQAAVSQ